MPLRFDLGVGERLYIGRSVITNGKSRSMFVLDGDLPVLKEKDFVDPAIADTVLERLYVHVQQSYLYEVPAAEFGALAALAVSEAPETYASLTEVDALVVAGDLYRALKILRKIIRTRSSEVQRHVADVSE